MGRRTKYHFNAGHQFGDWTIVDGVRHGKPAHVDAKCVCGNIKRIDLYSLIHHRSTNCGCKKIGSFSKQWTGVKNLSGTAIFRNIQNASTISNVNVGIEDLSNLYVAQNSSCAITGQPLASDTAKLVRYDNSLPYKSGNIAWVHSDVYKAVSPLGISGVSTMANSLASNATSKNIFEALGFEPVDTGEIK